jgi:hypothetical protein
VHFLFFFVAIQAQSQQAVMPYTILQNSTQPAKNLSQGTIIPHFPDGT